MKKKNSAHGSQTLAGLSPQEKEQLKASIEKHAVNGDNSALAKNLATKYGLSQFDILGIIGRRRCGIGNDLGSRQRIS